VGGSSGARAATRRSQVGPVNSQIPNRPRRARAPEARQKLAQPACPERSRRVRAGNGSKKYPQRQRCGTHLFSAIQSKVLIRQGPELFRTNQEFLAGALTLIRRRPAIIIPLMSTRMARSAFVRNRQRNAQGYGCLRGLFVQLIKSNIQRPAVRAPRL